MRTNHAQFVQNHQAHQQRSWGPLEFVNGGSEGPMSHWKIADLQSGKPHGSCVDCSGHASREEAIAHWREHVMANEIEIVADCGSMGNCLVCGNDGVKHSQMMQIGKDPIVDCIWVCSEHANRVAIEPHFTMPPLVVHAFAHSRDVPQGM